MHHWLCSGSAGGLQHQEENGQRLPHGRRRARAHAAAAAAPGPGAAGAARGQQEAPHARGGPLGPAAGVGRRPALPALPPRLGRRRRAALGAGPRRALAGRVCAELHGELRCRQERRVPAQHELPLGAAEAGVLQRLRLIAPQHCRSLSRRLRGPGHQGRGREGLVHDHGLHDGHRHLLHDQSPAVDRRLRDAGALLDAHKDDAVAPQLRLAAALPQTEGEDVEQPHQ
mmetsp:Transcript_36451/g.104181  ORF Transcript_36451/g.104181 Transcript_36451/m.104181 type:complete len:228 (-) Transcript_36451:274-957(-)